MSNLEASGAASTASSSTARTPVKAPPPTIARRYAENLSVGEPVELNAAYVHAALNRTEALNEVMNAEGPPEPAAPMRGETQAEVAPQPEPEPVAAPEVELRARGKRYSEIMKAFRRGRSPWAITLKP